MKLKSLLAASALALSAATTAHAADIVVHNTVPVVVVPSFSWTGFYLGAQAGYSWAKDKNVYSFGGNATTSQNLDSHGFMGGLFAGFNSDFSSAAVFGIETDFAWSNFSKAFSNEAFASEDPAAGGSIINGFTKVNWNGATRLRVGYSADRVMPYLAGGVAYTGIHTKSSASDTAMAPDQDQAQASSASEDSHHAMVGWTIGAGVDYAAVDNVILRLEYRYNDYGKKEVGVQNLSHKKTLSSNDIRVGIAYKF